IDECKEETFNCTELLKCKNLIGAYECGCEDGLVETTDGTCRGWRSYKVFEKSNLSDFDLSEVESGDEGDEEWTTEPAPVQVHPFVANTGSISVTTGFSALDFFKLVGFCESNFDRIAEETNHYNECELNKDICGSNSVCSNTEGSYKCNCEVGYKSANDGGKKCFVHPFSLADHDECTTGQPCNPNMICKNTFGSYTCGCREGYRLDQMHCAEIDECKEETYNCPEFSSCKNQNGSYECLCKGGYRKASDGNCSEICHPECEANSYCQNGKCQQGQ
ncbi:hypothetical protein pdam_00009967, partial [Pocillopora damicornis]